MMRPPGAIAPAVGVDILSAKRSRENAAIYEETAWYLAEQVLMQDGTGVVCSHLSAPPAAPGHLTSRQNLAAVGDREAAACLFL